MRRLRGEAGSIAVMIPIMAFIMLMLGGVVIDGSRLLDARSRAVAYAEEAARAGASAVEQGETTLRLDPVLVAERVTAFCDALETDPALTAQELDCHLNTAEGPDGITEVGDGDPRRIVVNVEVTMSMQTTLLGIVGKQSFSLRGQGRAQPSEGVNAGDVDSDPSVPDLPTPITPVLPPNAVSVGPTDPEPLPLPTCPPGVTPVPDPADPLAVYVCPAPVDPPPTPEPTPGDPPLDPSPPVEPVPPVPPAPPAP